MTLSFAASVSVQVRADRQRCFLHIVPIDLRGIFTG